MERQPTLLAVGQATAPVLVRPTGRVDLLGIRLQPWAAGAVLRAPATALRDRIVALDDVRAPLARALGAMIEDPPAPEHRMVLVERMLERFAAHDDERAAAARDVVLLLARSPDLPAVRELARRSGRSSRAVQRVFADAVGLSPKMLVRIARVQRVLRLARAEPTLAWARVAARCGFHDQSHLVRDLRALAGVAPTMLPRGEGSLSAAMVDAGAPLA